MAMPREDADGTPHMSYFRSDVGLSFVWSGDPDRPIQVCTEGTGGPVKWVFLFNNQFDTTEPPLVNLNNFRAACDEWLWYAQNSTGEVPYTDPLNR